MRGGLWQNARNWSAGRLPTARDQACIPRGQTVELSHGSHRVGSLVAGGAVVVHDASLRLVDPATRTEIGYLTVRRHGVVTFSTAGFSMVSLDINGGAVSNGEGPHRRGPLKVPCGPHTPAEVRACAPPRRPKIARASVAAVRKTWRRFLQELRAGGDGESVARLLGPKACTDPAEDPPRSQHEHVLDCRYMIRYELSLGRIARMSDTLDDLSVRDGAGHARLLDGTEVTFARRRGRWLIWWFDRADPQ